MSSGLKDPPQDVEIKLAIRCFGEEVKDCSVMPDRVGTRRFKLCDIGLNPRDPGSISSEPRTRMRERSRSNIQNADISVTCIEKIIDKGRCATADIQYRSCEWYAGCSNQRQRLRRNRLIPGDLRGLLGRVDTLPVRFA